MRKANHPPKLAERILKGFCSEQVLEFLQGDLYELFYLRQEKYGRRQAQLRFFLDVLSAVRPFAIQASRSNATYAMFKNFFFTSIRNFKRQRRYFLTNLAGLTIGLTSFVLISFFIINELSYDRFHEKHEQIYRASNVAIINGLPNREAPASAPLGPILMEEYPEVMNAVRIVKSEPTLVIEGDRKFIEEALLFTDASLFEVFDFELLKGNAKHALEHQRSLVLTERQAIKYFGEADPIGKQLRLDSDSAHFTVTGVVANPPANSHIQFDMLASLSSRPDYDKGTNWIGYSAHTYLVLSKGADAGLLEQKMRDIFYKYMAPQIEYYTGQKISEWEASGNWVGYELLPLTDIHLKSDFVKELTPTGNQSYLFIYALIGLIILCIAVFNYVNMATAQSATRAREVGIRKVMGSSSSLLMKQFVFESVLLALLAGVLSAIMTHGLLPFFERILQKEFAYSLFSSFWVPSTLLMLSVLVGMLAGFYPAAVLSRFHPVWAMKSTLSSVGSSGWVRNGLVVLQFAASITIIIITMVVYHQIDFMLTKNLGFDKEQVMVIRRPDALEDHLSTFEEELKSHPNIVEVAHTKTLPGKGYDIRSYRPVDKSETFLFPNNLVGFDYETVMGLELVDGRFFEREHREADKHAVVINEAAASALGFENPVGEKLSSPWHMEHPITIIGVMKDYHVESLHQPVRPVSLEMMTEPEASFVNVRFKSDADVRKMTEHISDLWMGYTNDHPFQYFFFDEEYENLYQNETATGKVFVVLATLSILIACLGLVGLVSFKISTRRKEVGIRKVLGARTGALVWLLSHGMMRTTLIATLLSWPLAYFATNYWLQNFAERTDVNPWSFVIATLGVLVIGAISISYQTIKASMSNPTESLRQE